MSSAIYRFPAPSMASAEPLFDTLRAAVATDCGTLVTPEGPPPTAMANAPGVTATSGPCPIPARPAVPTTSPALLMFSVPKRMPGYCGWKVMGTVQTVLAGLTVPPTLQPLTVPTVNSCTPFCAGGTVMLLMALADCSVIDTFCEAELDPTAVVGRVAKLPPATAEE